MKLSSLAVSLVARSLTGVPLLANDAFFLSHNSFQSSFLAGVQTLLLVIKEEEAAGVFLRVVGIGAVTSFFIIQMVFDCLNDCSSFHSSV